MGLPPIHFRQRTFDWTAPYICGVVNATPDSFSDGGRYLQLDAALAQAEALIEAGADVLDVGGESTRPGATAVDARIERQRVVGIIEVLAARCGVPISVDTTKAEVARAAVEAGAELINDISGGHFEPRILEVAASADAAVILGHARGDSIAAIHGGDDAVGYDEVVVELGAVVARLPESLRSRVIVDPGLGFGKSAAMNLALCRRSGELAAALRCPVMVGPSRKRFVTAAAHAAANDMLARDAATVGAALAAFGAGAHLARVHNVALLRPALRVYHAIVMGGA